MHNYIRDRLHARSVIVEMKLQSYFRKSCNIIISKELIERLSDKGCQEHSAVGAH
jgi:hypothetical protein